MGNIRTQDELFRTTLRGISEDGIVRNVFYNTGFNIPLHLFYENILSKFSQEKS